MNPLDAWFERQASQVDRFTATSRAFIGACVVVLVWALTGPVFGFSDTWQLVINTGTTIVTFLMVFLLQNSQSRGAERDRDAAERDRQAAERDAAINRRTFEVLQIVELHIEESRKLHDATLKLLARIEGQERQELKLLQQELGPNNLPLEIDPELRPD